MTRRLAPWLLTTIAFVTFAPTASAHAGEGPPPTDPGAILTAWHFDLPLIVALALAAYAYLATTRSVDTAHPRNPWPKRRTVSFLLGLGALAFALISPIDTLADDLFTVHVVQHLLLVAVAAPLFAASGIGTLALRAAPATLRNGTLLPILHSRVVTIATFPLLGWIAFVAVMWGSHFSSLYNAALLDDGIHALEHLLYLSAAGLFWWPLVSPDPLRWRLHPGVRLVALLAQMPPMSFLAVTIIGASAPLYPAYLGRGAVFGLDALADQRIAGSLMWVAGDLSLLIPMAALAVAWIRHEEGEAKRVDARLERERRSRAPREA